MSDILNRKYISVTMPLINGCATYLNLCIEKIYNIKEKNRKIFSFSKKFPFFEIKTKKCVSFRYQEKYETLRDFSDPRITVDLTLNEFLTILNIEYNNYEKVLMYGTLNGN